MSEATNLISTSSSTFTNPVVNNKTQLTDENVAKKSHVTKKEATLNQEEQKEKQLNIRSDESHKENLQISKHNPQEMKMNCFSENISQTPTPYLEDFMKIEHIKHLLLHQKNLNPFMVQQIQTHGLESFGFHMGLMEDIHQLKADSTTYTQERKTTIIPIKMEREELPNKIKSVNVSSGQTKTKPHNEKLNIKTGNNCEQQSLPCDEIASPIDDGSQMTISSQITQFTDELINWDLIPEQNCIKLEKGTITNKLANNPSLIRKVGDKNYTQKQNPGQKSPVNLSDTHNLNLKTYTNQLSKLKKSQSLYFVNINRNNSDIYDSSNNFISYKKDIKPLFLPLLKSNSLILPRGLEYIHLPYFKPNFITKSSTPHTDMQMSAIYNNSFISHLEEKPKLHSDCDSLNLNFISIQESICENIENSNSITESHFSPKNIEQKKSKDTNSQNMRCQINFPNDETQLEKDPIENKKNYQKGDYSKKFNANCGAIDKLEETKPNQLNVIPRMLCKVNSTSLSGDSIDADMNPTKSFVIQNGSTEPLSSFRIFPSDKDLIKENILISDDNSNILSIISNKNISNKSRITENEATQSHLKCNSSNDSIDGKITSTCRSNSQKAYCLNHGTTSKHLKSNNLCLELEEGLSKATYEESSDDVDSVSTIPGNESEMTTFSRHIVFRKQKKGSKKRRSSPKLFTSSESSSVSDLEPTLCDTTKSTRDSSSSAFKSINYNIISHDNTLCSLASPQLTSTTSNDSISHDTTEFDSTTKSVTSSSTSQCSTTCGSSSSMSGTSNKTTSSDTTNTLETDTETPSSNSSDTISALSKRTKHKLRKINRHQSKRRVTARRINLRDSRSQISSTNKTNKAVKSTTHQSTKIDYLNTQETYKEVTYSKQSSDIEKDIETEETSISRSSTLSNVDTLPDSFYASSTKLKSDDSLPIYNSTSMVNNLDDQESTIQESDSTNTSCISSEINITIFDVNTSIFNHSDPTPPKGRSLPILKKGKFFEDPWFKNLRLKFMDSVYEILQMFKVEGFSVSFVYDYRMIRAIDPKEENQAIVVYKENGIFKVIIDMETFMNDKIEVTLFNNSEIVIEVKSLSSLDGKPSELQCLFSKCFILPEESLTNQIYCILSSDGIMVILVNTSHAFTCSSDSDTDTSTEINNH